MNKGEVKVGVIYEASWMDCCTKGDFVSRVESANFLKTDDGEEVISDLWFENGVHLELPFDQVRFEEVVQ